MDSRPISHTALVTERVTYRQVLGVREFLAIAVSQGLSILGDQVARIAVALLVYARSHSALATAATYACSYLPGLLGGPVLSALADRYRRRTIMVVCDLVRTVLVLLLVLPHVPLLAVFAVLVLVELLAPPFNAARAGTLPDVLPGEQYIVGNAVLNVVFQGALVLGFVAGGLLVATLSTRGALAVDAATFALSTVTVLLGVRDRPAAQDAASRGSLLGDTAAGVRAVRSEPLLVRLLTLAVLGVAVGVAPEGLAVPVASSLHGGEVAAGVLTACVPAGFLLGSVAVLRVPAERRVRLLPRLVALSCVPLLLTPLVPSLPVVALLWFVAGTGTATQLIASAAYVQACPTEIRSRAYGVAATALMGAQGLSLLLTGALAEAVSSATSVAVAALVVLLLLPLAARGILGRGASAQVRIGILRRAQG